MKIILNRISIAVIGLMFTFSAHADFIGFNIGASYWSPKLTGNFSSQGDVAINLSDDLGVDDPSSSSLVLTLEHPVPFLPNVRYQGIDFDSRGNKQLANNINFNGQPYAAGETVRTRFDLSHNDIVLYYEVLDNWVNLDVGLDLKQFDGEVSLVGSANTNISSVKVDDTIPLIYLSARFDLPFSGFYVGADVSRFSIDDSSAEDMTIKLGYESDIGFGIEGGLKTFSLELDNVNGLDSNIEYDGGFVSGFYHF